MLLIEKAGLVSWHEIMQLRSLTSRGRPEQIWFYDVPRWLKVPLAHEIANGTPFHEHELPNWCYIIKQCVSASVTQGIAGSWKMSTFFPYTVIYTNLFIIWGMVSSCLRKMFRKRCNFFPAVGCYIYNKCFCILMRESFYLKDCKFRYK